MGNVGRLTLALAGTAAAVVLFLVFRPGGDDGAAVVATTADSGTATETDGGESLTETEPAADGPTTVAILVRGGEVEGGVRRVEVRQGERVRLVVRADVLDHVHLHGYDVVRDVAPGAPAQLVFTADVAGRFEVELEERRLPIAEIEVRP